MLIIKTCTYIPGVSSITEIVGKKKKLDFDNGKAIEVTEEQYKAIAALKWCIIKEKEVKDVG